MAVIGIPPKIHPANCIKKSDHYTDEEADALDEYYTENPPVPGPNGTGFFTQQRKAARSITVDALSAEWLLTKALADHKTPADVISEMVQREIAASA